PDPGAVQQPCFFHEPVYFFVVDDPAQFPELGRHILVSIATEFLAEDQFYLHNDHPVFHPFATSRKAMGTGLYAFAGTRTLVIKAAGCQLSPFQQASNRYAAK